MDSATITCHRLLYLYDISQQEDIIKKDIIDPNYPTDREKLYRMVDKAINCVDYSNLPEELKRIWLEDKFHYVSWIRDSLLE